MYCVAMFYACMLEVFVVVVVVVCQVMCTSCVSLALITWLRIYFVAFKCTRVYDVTYVLVVYLVNACPRFNVHIIITSLKK